MQKKNLLHTLGFHLLAGLILVVPALMNHAPLVYSDSGTYLVSSRSLMAPIDRPIGYGLIIRAVTWQSTLWTIVFFQGMVASWLIQRTTGTLFPKIRGAWRPHIVIMAILLAISSLPWYVSQLMPDVFSGMLALCVFLLLFGRELSKVEIALLWILLFFFAITHYSYLSLLLLTGVACAILFGYRKRQRSLPYRTAVLSGLIITPLLGILFVMGSNARQGHGFVISPTSSLFLAGKLIESGAMYMYLDAHCEEHPNFLCASKNELNRSGMHYVWDDLAPTRQGADLVTASKRLDPIVHDLLSEPRMWPFLVWTSALSTVLQLATIDIGVDVHAYKELSAPWYPISQHLQHELPMYMESVQQRNSWGLGYLIPIVMWVLLISCVVIITRWPPKHQIRWWSFMLIIVGFTIANAASTGALANIYDRLQSRLTWLLLFAALLLLARRLRSVRNLLCFDVPSPKVIEQ